MIHVALFTMQSLFSYKKFRTTSILEIFQYNIHTTNFFFDFYSLPFTLIKRQLYKHRQDKVCRKCWTSDYTQMVLQKMH